MKTFGYILFLLSCILWALIAIIPWFGFSKSQLAVMITVLVIFGEVTFYASVLILGKSFIKKIWQKLKFRKRKSEDTNEEGN